MSKSVRTKLCEKAIFKYSKADKLGVYGAFEVTLGKGYGKERVDYMTMTSSGIFTCYEIKVSKQDFNSEAKKSFYGDYNYFVMPQFLYDELKNTEDLRKYLWSGIGVCVVDLDTGNVEIVNKAKKRNCFQDHQMLMFGMIRSLSKLLATTYICE